MSNTLAYEVSFWYFTIDLGTGIFSAILSGALVIVALVASIDGATLAFRGIRDTIASNRRGGGAPTALVRFVSTIATVLLFLTGGALIVGLAAWLCGASALFRMVSLPRGRASGAKHPAEEGLHA